MIGYGIIREDGSVLEEDGKIHYLPLRGKDSEGYPEVLVDAEEAGGSGWMRRQSVKPFIGYRVVFVRNTPDTHPFNHVIVSKQENESQPQET